MTHSYAMNFAKRYRGGLLADVSDIFIIYGSIELSLQLVLLNKLRIWVWERH